MKNTSALLIVGLATAGWSVMAAEKQLDISKIDVSKLPPAADKKGVTYAKDIRPIFEASCFRCHGEERQKGDLRLDSREAALRGGEHGKAILPGDSANSPLVLVVAGATVEPIDDVRVITNRSTGGTGIELAKAAFEHGANVELWLGRHEVEVPSWLSTKPFETTNDLMAMAEKAEADICIVPAAVSDFAPSKKQPGKIPSRSGALTLDLQPTPKVLNRFRKGARKALVGFKAEAGLGAVELKGQAMALVKEADVDFVVANDVSKVKEDSTSITIFDRKGQAETFAGSKALAAERVWRVILHGVRG